MMKYVLHQYWSILSYIWNEKTFHVLPLSFLSTWFYLVTFYILCFTWWVIPGNQQRYFTENTVINHFLTCHIHVLPFTRDLYILILNYHLGCHLAVVSMPRRPLSLSLLIFKCFTFYLFMVYALNGSYIKHKYFQT